MHTFKINSSNIDDIDQTTIYWGNTPTMPTNLSMYKIYCATNGKSVEMFEVDYGGLRRMTNVFLGTHRNGIVYYQMQYSIYKIRNRKGAHAGVHRQLEIEDFPKHIKMHRLLEES